MKALTKIAIIALILNSTFIGTAGARPKAPGRYGSLVNWCSDNAGNFFSYGNPETGYYCEECEIGDFAGKTDLYTCCVRDGTASCGWKACTRPGGTGGGQQPGAQRVCVAAKTADLLPNLDLDSLRSQPKVPVQPDLVALPAPASMPPEGFCRRNDQGQLLIKIYNQGGTDVAATKTRVKFGSADPTDFDTPGIPAGKGTELVINIPNACFDVNNKCAFTIGADATETTAESNETNNNAAGLCGPQFF